MIDPKTLTEEDVDRLVVYTPYEGASPEQGRITSYNDRWIYVDYQNVGRGQATPPDKLDYVSKDRD